MLKTILVSNDDGFDAPGLSVLVKSLAPLGRVISVAPEGQRSAVSHQITLHKPLRLWENSPDQFVCSGSPADCVNLGIHNLCDGAPPDLVVSGINRGANLGSDVFYSGTVAAALEGCLHGVPAMAVSLVVTNKEEFYGEGLHPAVPYDAAGKVAFEWAKMVLERGLSDQTFLNINVPQGYESHRGERVASLGRTLTGPAPPQRRRTVVPTPLVQGDPTKNFFGCRTACKQRASST